MPFQPNLVLDEQLLDVGTDLGGAGQEVSIRKPGVKVLEPEGEGVDVDGVNKPEDIVIVYCFTILQPKAIAG